MSEDKVSDDIIDVEPQVIDPVHTGEKLGGRGSQLRRIGMGAVLGVAFAVAGAWFYRDLLVGYLPSDQVQALTTRVDALESANKESLKRVGAVVTLTEELKAKLGAAQASSEKSAKLNTDTSQLVQQDGLLLSQLQSGLEQMNTQVLDIKTKLANGSDVSSSAAVPDAALVGRIDALEKAVSAGKAVPILPPSLLPSLGVLTAKINNGEAFADALGPFAVLISKTSGVEAFNAEAAQGLPNAVQLAKEVHALKMNLPAAIANSAAANPGWLDWFGQALKRIVTVKFKTPDDWQVLASKAEAFADSGDLAQADLMFANISQPAPQALAAWREKLQRRIKLEQALEKLTVAVQQQQSAQGQP